MGALKTEDNNLWRIQRVGRFFSILWGLLAYIIPLLILAHWYLIPPLPLSRETLLFCLLHLAVVLITAGPLVLSLVHLKHLFSLFGEGIIFGKENVTRIRKFGSSLLLFGLFQIAYFPLASLVSSAGKSAERSISVSFSSGAAVALGAGFVVVVIAWVMEEAHKLEEEQSYTV